MTPSGNMTSNQSLVTKYAAIGDELELAESVYFEWDEKGLLTKVEPGNPGGDVPNELALPCFINAHTHLGDSFAKEAGLNVPLEDLVSPPNGLKHHLLRTTPLEVIRSGMASSLESMLAAGTQVFGDFREGGAEGVHLLRSLLNLNLPQSAIFARYLENLEELTPLAPYLAGIGIPSPNGYDDQALEVINKFCKKYHLIFATHISEIEDARVISSSSYGLTDVERILQFDALKLLVHLTHISPKELDLIAQARVPTVLCPQSNVILTGCAPPVESFIERDIPFALGTDNVMVNPPSLWREIQFGLKLQKMRRPDLRLDPNQWLKAVTIHGARALNIATQMGSLVVGKRANFFTINLSSLNLSPSASPFATVILRGGAEDINAVHFNGKGVWKHE
ncbi:MAG: Pyrimidine deaminase archaeal predicted [Promethearchaeota archaeon CR_4]|nr:MAG: Pyrimidine deaminase archaeal predicted [Candidatus Lokiarchaeota archaeon CR_4]